MKVKMCLNCKERPAVHKFCSTTCSAHWLAKRYYRLHPNLIDKYLKVLTRKTDGKVTYGTLTDVALLVGVTRERVRQRANFLGYTPLRTLNKVKRPCVYCGKPYTPTRRIQMFCTPKCHHDFNFHKYYELFICEYCKQGFIKPKSEGHKRFCSKHCFGRYMAIQGNKTRKLSAKYMAKLEGGEKS